MGYYKDMFTHWGTVGDAAEDKRMDKVDARADDGHIKGSLPAPRSIFCRARMVDESGFDWGTAQVQYEYQYEQYKTEHPTWVFIFE